MLWVAVLSAFVLNVVWPLPFSVPVPRGVVPSLNVTVPVGVPLPPPPATTVAVKVTDCPWADGLISLASVVVVGDGLTIWLTVVDVLALKSVVAA